MPAKPTVLVVCTHLHADRSAKQDRDFMQPSAGLHVASLIDRDKYIVILHHEMYHGPLDPDSLGKIDVVFLTGLQKDFDRMRQLSYVFRYRGAITVGGGSLCSLFPEACCSFFNVVCQGGVDSVASVMDDYENKSLQTIYRSPQQNITSYRIRHDYLTESNIYTSVHLIEASRGCNFKCDFCVIPAEDARHTHYGVERIAESIIDSIDSSPRWSVKSLYPLVWFIDNNFSNNLPLLREMCAYLRCEKKVKAWGALVTQDILANHNVMKLMAKSKCRVLFTGLESLDPGFHKSHNKVQNLKKTQSIINNVRNAQRQGIVVMYGYLFDPRINSIKEMTEQLNAILESGVLQFPNFLSWVSPLLGTGLFWNSVKTGELRANLRVRDLEGQSIAYNNCIDDDKSLIQFSTKLFRDPMSLLDMKQFYKVFFKGLVNLNPRYPVSYLIHYHNSFRVKKLVKKRSKQVVRNYLGGSDVLDPQYRNFPSDISAGDFEKYFAPLMVTDSNGNLAEWLDQYRPDNECLVSGNSVEVSRI